MNLPEGAALILDTLSRRGHEAYAVGGCVRDSLMGKTPGDWDICTGATPDEVKRCFSQIPVLETGLKHGTVTLLIDHVPYEVTTFRTEGKYSDRRRPDEVRFVTSLEEDLKRRDFTINAMAYNPTAGLVDPFGGRKDLAGRVVRCVGDPGQRFGEDALRIMRALRFASALEFAIEPATGAAIHALRETLREISAERLFAELGKLIAGPGAAPVLCEYGDVLGVLLPELLPALSNPEEWRRRARQIAASPAERNLRLALLMRGMTPEAAIAALHRLKADRATSLQVFRMLKNQDAPLDPGEAPMRRLLHGLGEETARALLTFRRAIGDAEELRACAAQIDRIVAEGQCYRLNQLAVHGRDLMELGIADGREIGRTLNALLTLVIDGELENEREALLLAAFPQAHPKRKVFEDS